MNILSMMPRFNLDAAGPVEPTPGEKQRPGRNHGPVKTRSLTNGQIRRMVERERASQKRKANRRFRRQWMDNRLNTAILRGQLAALDKAALLPAEGSGYDPLYPARVLPIVDDLTAKYGSVDAAQAAYDEILAEAAA